jgi:uncharacterized SAM-binding protein YcdF (DUF218 family)
VRNLIRILALFGILALIVASWDFLTFVGKVEAARAPAADLPVDAVATLTGAADARIVAGVDLALKLGVPHLISGVHVNTRLSDIARIAGVEEARLDCCVTLGRAAASTEGNGSEVADWARRNKVKRILIVTSDYHMARAMVEVRRAMPEGEFVPFAVPSARLRVDDWYRDAASTRLLTSEWLKFRIASMRARGGGSSHPDTPDISRSPLPDADKPA